MDINNISELSFDFNESIELRKKKIILNPIGTIPRNSQQNNELGLPIAIMDYQYDLVRKHRSLEINDEVNRNIYKIVYEDLTLNYGYYLQQGSKYGSDFLLYKDDPDKCHSFAILNIISLKETILNIKEIILWQRVANKVNKKCIIALILERENANFYKREVIYITFENYINNLKIIR